MSTMQSMGLSLKDLIQMAFDSGWDARDSITYSPGELDRKFTEFLMILGLDELKVN